MALNRGGNAIQHPHDMTTTELFKELAEAIIGRPDSFSMEVKDSRGTQLIIADVPQEDYGRIIGGGGNIIEALRLVIAMSGAKHNQPFALHVPMKERKEQQKMPFVPNLNWRTAWLSELATATATAMFRKPCEIHATDTDDGKTCLTLRIDRSEPSPMPDAVVENALVAIFRAIGNANGRKVKFEMRRA